MTVVMVRGTSGSGKTTLVRSIVDDLEKPEELWRKHPLTGKSVLAGYVYPNEKLLLIGKYATECGGCDTLSWKGSADFICELALEFHLLGYNVLMEGLLVSSWGLPRQLQLHRDTGDGLVLATLTTPIELCLESVTQRRLAKGNTNPLNPANTIAKHEGIAKGLQRFRDAGLCVVEIDRESGPETIRTIFRESKK